MPSENSPERHSWTENPDWVTEKIRGDADSRSRDQGGASRWEERRSRGGRGGFERGRGGGSSRGFYGQQDEAEDGRWQHRNNNSGTGNDAYSRFNENRGRRKDEAGEHVFDRSGWSSASSWAVRKTLPADVQDYYSKRERGGPGVWNRQEEEPAAAAG